MPRSTTPFFSALWRTRFARDANLSVLIDSSRHLSDGDTVHTTATRALPCSDGCSRRVSFESRKGRCCCAGGDAPLPSARGEDAAAPSPGGPAAPRSESRAMILESVSSDLLMWAPSRRRPSCDAFGRAARARALSLPARSTRLRMETSVRASGVVPLALDSIVRRKTVWERLLYAL